MKSTSDKSTVTSSLFHSSNPAGSPGAPVIFFFATENHAPGYEVVSTEIASATNGAGDPQPSPKSFLSSLLLGLVGDGEPTFSETMNCVEGPDGSSVRFVAVRKLTPEDKSPAILLDLYAQKPTLS